jgi:hypothetical protein
VIKLKKEKLGAYNVFRIPREQLEYWEDCYVRYLKLMNDKSDIPLELER